MPGQDPALLCLWAQALQPGVCEVKAAEQPWGVTQLRGARRSSSAGAGPNCAVLGASASSDQFSCSLLVKKRAAIYSELNRHQRDETTV